MSLSPSIPLFLSTYLIHQNKFISIVLFSFLLFLSLPISIYLSIYLSLSSDPSIYHISGLRHVYRTSYTSSPNPPPNPTTPLTNSVRPHPAPLKLTPTRPHDVMPMTANQGQPPCIYINMYMSSDRGKLKKNM